MAAVSRQLVGCCSARPRHLHFAIGHYIHAHAPLPCKLPLAPSVGRSMVSMRLRRLLFTSNHQGHACSAAATSSSSTTTTTTSGSGSTPGNLLLWSVPVPAAAWSGWAIYQRIIELLNLVVPPLQQVMTGTAVGATTLTGMLVIFAFVFTYFTRGSVLRPDEFLDASARHVLSKTAAVGGLFGACNTSPEVVSLLFVVAAALTVASGCHVLVLLMVDMASNLLAAAVKGVRKVMSGLRAKQSSHNKTPAASELAEMTECASELNEFDQLLARSGQ